MPWKMTPSFNHQCDLIASGSKIMFEENLSLLMQYSNYGRGGWSQFWWNACLISAHHMQCIILLIQRVVWVSTHCSHGKQALTKIRDHLS